MHEESLIFRDAFFRTFRNGVENGIAELMLTNDLSLDGSGIRTHFPINKTKGKFCKPLETSVNAQIDHVYNIVDIVEIQFKHAKWTRAWIFHECKKEFNAKVSYIPNFLNLPC